MKFDFSQKPNVTRRQFKGEVEKPIISIIMPYYNGGQYIDETIKSVLGQTFPYYEWIIVDDGSTDEQSIKKLDELEAIDSRIRVHKKESNTGLADTRNVGASLTTGEYICFLDCDDFISETYLEKLLFTLLTNKGASWAYCDVVGFDKQEYLWKKQFDSEVLKTDNFLVATSLLRREAFDSTNGFNTTQKQLYEDWAFWLELISKEKYPVHINGYDFWYRRRDGLLAEINNDTNKTKSSLDVIKQQAKKVKKPVTAIEYPRVKTKSFEQPKEIECDIKPVVNDNKKRMLMMIPHMEMGGADLFNVDLVSRINKDEYEISIITTNPAENTWKQRFEKHVTDIFELPNFLDMEYWASFVEYFIESRKIDVLMVTNSYYGYYMIPYLRSKFENLAIVDYVHMEEMYWRNGGYARTAGALADVLEKTYVCNERTRNVLINEFGRKPETVETVYIGVDEKEFDRNIETEDVKAKHKIDDNKKVVLFPCRMHPQKRPYLMLEIAKKVEKLNKNIVFLAVGDGSQYDEVKAKATSNVVFAGRQDDMKSYYKASDVTLICSIKEGLALTAYESMSMSVPVITADVGGQGELIDNTVGYIFPMMQDEADIDNRNFEKEEITQYVDAIIEILGNDELYKEKSEKCRTRIVEGFTKDKMVRRFENEIDMLSQESARRKNDFEMLGKYPNLVTDYLTLFNEYSGKESELEALWQAKCYFENLYAKTQSTESSRISADSTDSELDRLYSMRSVKLALKYQSFMDNSKFGKFLSKIRDLLFN